MGSPSDAIFEVAGLRFERDGELAWLIVDNPSRRNSLSMAMYRGLGTAIRLVRDDPGLQALIVTGTGDAFITGGDIGDHQDDDEPGLPFELLQHGTVPVVAAVNGHCLASGVLLSILADVAVASDRAIFRLPELRLGVAAPWSSSLLPGVIGMARAKELALTSRPFDAAEAHSMGLIASVVPHGELRERAIEVALELLEAAPEARLRWKRAAHASWPNVSDAEVSASIATDEAAEGFAAFMARRPPNWSPRNSSRSTTESAH